MSFIPSDCLWGILTRLPVEALLRFRCICKAWLQIIDDPLFIKLHLHRQNGGNQLFITGGDGIYWVSLDALCDSYSQPKTICTTRLKTSPVSRSRVFALPSCNGLIIVPGLSEKGIWELCNPFTGEFRELLPDIPSEGISFPSCGLAYDSVSDDYKVVRISEIFHPTEKKSETLVYSLKQNSWRRIADCPCLVDGLPGTMGDGYFVNGSIHWITYNSTCERKILALDLDTEKYRFIPLPPVIRGAGTAYLDLLAGCLILSCGYSGWIMNEYASESNDNSCVWTILYSFSKDQLPGTKQYSGEFRPVAYLKNKGLVLIQYKFDEFLWFDVEKKLVKTVPVCGVPRFLTSQVLPASLVRLN